MNVKFKEINASKGKQRVLNIHTLASNVFMEDNSNLQEYSNNKYIKFFCSSDERNINIPDIKQRSNKNPTVKAVHNSAVTRHYIPVILYSEFPLNY